MRPKTLSRIRLTYVLLALATAQLVAAPREAGTYQVRPGDSLVQFTLSKWTVFKEEGRFRDFSGTIVYDPANPAASSVALAVRVASIDTKIEGRDRTLLDADFFHADRYPTMTFRSTRVERLDPETLAVTGDLTIRGVTRRITAPVKLLGFSAVREMGMLAGFETTFTLDRHDFGVLGLGWSGGNLILGHEVTVHLILSAESGPSTARR